jgi:hypothetical protein
MIRFANNFALYLLALIPVLIIFFYLAFHWKKLAMQRFGSLLLVQQLTPSVSRKDRRGKSCCCSRLVLTILAWRGRSRHEAEEVKRKAWTS